MHSPRKLLFISITVVSMLMVVSLFIFTTTKKPLTADERGGIAYEKDTQIIESRYPLFRYLPFRGLLFLVTYQRVDNPEDLYQYELVIETEDKEELEIALDWIRSVGEDPGKYSIKHTYGITLPSYTDPEYNEGH